MRTWAELREEIQTETNTEGEEFFTPEELRAWANDGIREAEKEIITMHDKYLETEGKLELVEGEHEIQLPPNIYANKITQIFYDGGEGRFEIKPMKRREERYELCGLDQYKYRILNNTTGRVIKIYPAARETSSDVVDILYVRNASLIEDDDDIIDIPIADNFIKQYIKDKMLEKELGPGAIRWPTSSLQSERRLLVEALNQMIPDENNDLEVDLSFYEDFDNDPFERF